MRTYACYLYTMKNDKLTDTTSTACFACVSHHLGKDLYIDRYTEDETKDYIDLIVKTINGVTLCELVTINNKDYIRIELLNGYNQNLILLNFIRNLWHEPFAGYSLNFFKALEKEQDKDALVRLTTANKKALEIKEYNNNYSPGHSNVHKASSLKIKTKEDLLKGEPASTASFLTT